MDCTRKRSNNADMSKITTIMISCNAENDLEYDEKSFLNWAHYIFALFISHWPNLVVWSGTKIHLKTGWCCHEYKGCKEICQQVFTRFQSSRQVCSHGILCFECYNFYFHCQYLSYLLNMEEISSGFVDSDEGI